MDTLQERKTQWTRRRDEYFISWTNTGTGNASAQRELEAEFLTLLVEEYAPETVANHQRYNRKALRI